MLQLDCAAFLRALATLPGADPDDPAPFGEGYLIQYFVLPFLDGQAVSLRDLDFEAFDEDDVRCLEQRIDVRSGTLTPVRTIYGHLLRCRPRTAGAAPFV